MNKREFFCTSTHFVAEIPNHPKDIVSVTTDRGTSHFSPSENVDAVLFFVGYAIIKNNFITSQNQLCDLLKKDLSAVNCIDSSDGSFAALIFNQGFFQFITDPNGLEQAFIYQGEKTTFISTSFFALAEILLSRGISLSANNDVISRFLRIENVYDTAFCDASLVNEISLIPYNTKLKLFYQGGRLKLSEVRLNSIRLLAESHTYHELLEIGASKVMAKIDLASRVASTPMLSLSGGSDSRILYAAAKRMAISNLYILTAGSGRDRQVSDTLTRTGGDLINSKFPRRKTIPISPEQAIRRWEISNLGLYSFLDISQVKVIDPYEVIEIRGGGALRQAYPEDGRDLSGLNDLSDVDECFFKSDLAKPFGYLNWKDIHYLSFRNRIHVGRNHAEGQRVACRFDPLQTPELHAAASVTPPEERLNYKIYCDLLLMLNPQYAFIEFDKPYKRFDGRILKNSKYLGANVDIDFQRISYDSNSFHQENSWAVQSEPQTISSWLSEDDFNVKVDNIIVDQIREALPTTYSSVVEKTLKMFFDSKEGRMGRGRQVTKLFALSRLRSIGVSF